MNRLAAGIGALACAALVLGYIGSEQSTAADATAPAKKPVAKKLTVGDAAPAWKELKGIDDKAHSLKELDKAKAIVVVFTCNHCPVAQAYEGRLGEFAKQYKDKGVELIAINVSLGEADNAQATMEKAKEKGFAFSYLLDPSQDIGRAYGATVTPHVFVLDGKRKVAYMGAFDDDMDAGKVRKHYVSDAVDAVLAGKTPEVAVSKQFGCGISYE